MTRVLMGLVILAVLFIGGDIFLKNVTETRAEKQVENLLDLRTTPEVELGGWPFIVRALSGSFPTVELSVTDTRLRGVELEDVQISLTDVGFSLGELLGGSQEAVKFGGGEGSAVMTSEGMTQALRRQGTPAKISLNEDGSVTIRDPRLPQEVTGEMTLEGRSIVVSADGVPQTYTIRLPRLVRGISYDSLTIGEDRAELTFSVAAGTLAAP